MVNNVPCPVTIFEPEVDVGDVPERMFEYTTQLRLNAEMKETRSPRRALNEAGVGKGITEPLVGDEEDCFAIFALPLGVRVKQILRQTRGEARFEVLQARSVLPIEQQRKSVGELGGRVPDAVIGVGQVQALLGVADGNIGLAPNLVAQAEVHIGQRALRVYAEAPRANAPWLQGARQFSSAPTPDWLASGSGLHRQGHIPRRDGTVRRKRAGEAGRRRCSH